MAITGPSSYIPTTDEFIVHWTAADASLGVAGPITVLKGISRTGLADLRGQLEAKRAQVQALRNGREIARAGIEAGKTALLGRLGQFRQKMRSLAPDSPWEAALPKAFSVSEGYGRVIPPLDELADLWARYETKEGLLTLMGLYTCTDFGNDLTALKAAYTALIAADHSLGLVRSQRTELERKIHGVLKAYRQRIPAEFPIGDPVLDTLPRLTPPDIDRDPAPVQANGLWNTTTVKAELNWTSSTDADLTHYEVRAVAGPDYEVEDESPVATVLSSEPRAWSGDFALGSPGSAATFRVYVVLGTGHERGSNPVTITRPAAEV
ncbi:MAG: hypothetical protein V4726_25145 [Verrucomicrobiota bacterium]